MGDVPHDRAWTGPHALRSEQKSTSLDVVRDAARAQHIARSRFESPEFPRMRAKAIAGGVEVAQNAMSDTGALGERLLAHGSDGLAHEINRAIDKGHRTDRKGIKIPLSSQSRGKGTNHPLGLGPSARNSYAMAVASDDRRKAIKRFMTARGLKPKPWAMNAGLSPKTLANFLNGDSESVTHTSLEKLARAADATIAEIIGERPAQPRAGREIVTVQGLEVRAAMGEGVEISEEPAGEPFYFRKSFVDRIARGKQVRLRVIELTGDSMFPTMQDGDVALVDLNSTDVNRSPGIYCIWSNNGLQVKRVQIVPGSRPKLRIQSDNRERYDRADEVAIDDVRIIGRVVWRGGMV